MKITRYDSMTAKVSHELEKQILSGQYPPGSRLLGARQLSEKFGVSRIIIRSAIERLEKKQLVVTLPSKGVYINDKILSLNSIELFILSYIGPDGRPMFIENAMNLHRDYQYRRRFNLTLRCIGWSRLNAETFQHELSKAHSVHAEILLLGSTYIDRERLNILDANGIPYLIAGELHHELPDREFNQIYARYSAKVVEIAGFLARQPYRKITYFAYPAGSFDYESALLLALHAELARNNQELEVVIMEPEQQQEPDDPALHLDALRRLLESGNRPEFLYMLHGVDLDTLAGLLAEYGLELGRNIQLLVPRNVVRGKARGAWFIDFDYSRFADTVYARLAEIHHNPESCRKIDVSESVQVSIDREGEIIALPLEAKS